MMKIRLLLSIILLPVFACASAKPLQVGDGQIDGSKIKPYRLVWKQCAKQDGKWQPLPDLTEELVIIGEQISRLRQFTQQPDGVEIESTTYFDQSSFAPLRMETRVTAADGASLAGSWHNLNTDGYTGISTRGGVRQEVSGKISALMLHGGAMGLPLTTLAEDSTPVTFPASMMQFDATYDVQIEWSGTEAIEYQGNKFQAFLADVRWQHHESSDVYPPGPDASGGQYWLVPSPPAGFPYVPRYQTDSYAVEFYPLVCP